MPNFIEKLQNQPRHVRVVVLWAAVSVCMFALFVFWVNTLDLGLSAPAGRQEQASDSEKSFLEIKEQVPSLWQSLKAGAGGLFETIDKEAQKEDSGVNMETESQNEEALPRLP